MVGAAIRLEQIKTFCSVALEAQENSGPGFRRPVFRLVYRRFNNLPMAIILIIIGVAIFAFLIYWGLTAPSIIHVPEGKNPLTYFGKWRNQRLTKRFPRWFWILAGLAIGMIISGGVVGAVLG